MRVVAVCAKCGEKLDASIKPYKEVKAPRCVMSDDVALFVAPCYYCTDVDRQVNDVLKKAYALIKEEEEKPS